MGLINTCEYRKQLWPESYQLEVLNSHPMYRTSWWSPGAITHRIRMYAIYGYIYIIIYMVTFTINIPQMLAYIPYWILWVMGWFLRGWSIMQQLFSADLGWWPLVNQGPTLRQQNGLLWQRYSTKTGWWFGCHFSFSHILGISSSQLTNSYFSEGWLKTTNQLWFLQARFNRFSLLTKLEKCHRIFSTQRGNSSTRARPFPTERRGFLVLFHPRSQGVDNGGFQLVMGGTPNSWLV